MKEVYYMIDSFDLTILIPCLDEEETLADCLRNAQKALLEICEEYQITGEVLLVDNGSKDLSPQIAVELGARFVSCEDRGYGNAIKFGVQNLNSEWVIIGDADCSYDFFDAKSILQNLKSGTDLCLGSRFTGNIKPLAMPFLNKYLGNPLLTYLLNLRCRTKLTDAHCGLRGFSRQIFNLLEITSSGMEINTEMIIKASRLNSVIKEVPVTLHPDKRTKKPHLRPFRDGLRNLLCLVNLEILNKKLDI